MIIPKSVISIGSYAFSRTFIHELLFENNSSLTNIDNSTFSNITTLKSISLPNSLEIIGREAFSNCFKLTGELIIPSKTSVIKAQAFYGCNLTKVIFDQGQESSALTEIQEWAFSENYNLKGILEIPYGVTIIGQSSFSLTAIEEVTFSSEGMLEEIQTGAFSSISSLSGSITLPQNIKILQRYAFADTSITQLHFTGNRLEKIESNAFSGTSLEHIDAFPDSLTSIGESAFSGCLIETIEFSLTTHYTMKIGSYAFSNCIKLKNITIKYGEIGSFAFANCSSLTSYNENSLTSIGQRAFAGTQIKQFHIPYRCELEFHAFSDMPKLETIIIEGSNHNYLTIFAIKNSPLVTNIEISNRDVLIMLITNMPNLKSIQFTECTVQIYGQNDNYPIKIPGETNGYALSSLESLENISIYQHTSLTIGDYAMYNLNKFEHITTDFTSYVFRISTSGITNCPALSFDFPVTEISSHAVDTITYEQLTIYAKIVRDNAFSDCPQLKILKISENVEYLGEHFIENCPNLVSVEFLYVYKVTPLLNISSRAFWKMNTFDLANRLPDRTNIIGSLAFAGCTRITGSLDLPKKLTRIEANAFQGCTGLTGFLDFQRCEVLDTIEECAFLSCSHISGSLELPDSLTFIGKYAFTYCNFAGPLTIPNNVRKIQSHAFSMCNSFTGSIYIGRSVEYIGENAFSECTGLNVRSVEYIGKNAFYGCINLQGMLILPSSVKNIGSLAFYNCHSLTGTLVLPYNLTNIGDSAFAYCSGFTGILVIPPTVTFIGKQAFFRCSGFSEVQFSKKFTPENSTSVLFIDDKAFGELNIRCLSNVPSICSISNSSNKIGYPDDAHSRCYDSSGFDYLSNLGTIGENCTLRDTLEILIMCVSLIAATGIFGISAKLILKWFNEIYSQTRHIQLLFNDVIAIGKHDFSKSRNQNEVTQSMIDSIQTAILQENDNPNFSLSKNQLNTMLMKAIKKEWPGILFHMQKKLFEQSFEEMNFVNLEKRKKKKCCCNSHNKRSTSEYLSDPSEQPLDTSLI